MKIKSLMNNEHQFFDVISGKVYDKNYKVIYTIRRGKLYKYLGNGKPMMFICNKDNTIRDEFNHIKFVFNKSQFTGLDLPVGYNSKKFYNN